MNILKLAEKSQVFSLDEIELLAEKDCAEELSDLIAQNALIFDGAVYKFCRKESFTIYSTQKYELKVEPEINMQTPFAKAGHGYLLSRNLSRTSLKKYRGQLKNHLCPYFGDMQLKKITAKTLIDFINTDKGDYSQWSRIKDIVFTGSILKWAFKEGFIKKNPYLKVKHIVAKMKREQAKKRIASRG